VTANPASPEYTLGLISSIGGAVWGSQILYWEGTPLPSTKSHKTAIRSQRAALQEAVDRRWRHRRHERIGVIGTRLLKRCVMSRAPHATAAAVTSLPAPLCPIDTTTPARASSGMTERAPRTSGANVMMRALVGASGA
jgi:hypothetical protein